MRMASLGAMTEPGQTLVEREGVAVPDHEPSEISMAEIQQEVVLAGHDGRRHA
jgi:hypothetical protein